MQPANQELGRSFQNFNVSFRGNTSDILNSPSSPDNKDTQPIHDSNRHSIVVDAPLDEQLAGGIPDDVESDDEDASSGKEEEASEGTADTVGLMRLGSAD
jgi:hypothetical protein